MKMNAFLPHNRKELLSFAYGVIIAVFFMQYYLQYLEIGSSSNLKGTKAFQALPIPMDAFPEPAWRTPGTIGVKTIASTAFARFEIHQVKTESGDIVNDWLWTDERSHVNILVHLKAENKYLLFYQKKYGLEKQYYAAIGGLFNNGE